MGSSRFRLRTLMIAVALLAVVLSQGHAILRRYDRAAALASYHKGQLSARYHATAGRDRERIWWHAQMLEKYKRSARSPWFPVPPDPPEPE